MVYKSPEQNLFKLYDGVGIPGKDGQDGKDAPTLYSWIKYSQKADGSQMTDNSANAKYIGIAYNKTTPTESTIPGDYSWSLIKGADGQDGQDGYTVILSNESQSISTSAALKPIESKSYTCQITVLHGIDKLSPALNTPGSGQFKVALPANPAGITLSQGVAGIVTFSVSTANAISANGTIDLIITVGGLDTAITKSISYSASKAGNDGSNGKDGKDAVSPASVLLSNENHTFSANAAGQAYGTTITTEVSGFMGATPAATTVGTITGLPTGMTTVITNNGATNTSISIATTSALTTLNGVVNIPITVNGILFNKKFSYALSKTGETGSPGANAKIVDITASSQVFKSTDGGLTFAPDTIKLTPLFQGGISYSKWQYSKDGGVTWADVINGSNGFTIASGVLTIAKTCNIFTDTITALCFKCISNDANYYDTMTVLKLYDVTDIQIGGRNLIENSTFRNHGEGWSIINYIASYETDPSIGHYMLFHCSSSGYDNSDRIYQHPFANNESHIVGQTYALSFYAKASSATNIHAGCVYSLNEFKITTEWKKYVQIYTPTKSGSLTFHIDTTNVKLYLSQIKLEKGNKATDWTPAPEDIDTSITEVKSSISGVSSKVDAVQKTITDKIWQTDISEKIDAYNKTTVKAISDRVAKTETSIDGISATVSDVKSTLAKKADGTTVSALDQRVTKSEQSLDGFKQTVGSTYTTKTDVDNKFKSYSTTTEMNSAISQTKDSITQEVSKNYTAKVDGDKIVQGLNKWILEVYQLTSATMPNPRVADIKNIQGKVPTKILEKKDTELSPALAVGDFYIGHAFTCLYFDAPYTWIGTVVTDDEGAVYLNGTKIVNTTSVVSTSLSLPFQAGWNILEVVYNEGINGDGWKFSSTLSALPQCNIMNCYAQVSINANALMKITADGINSKVENNAAYSEVVQQAEKMAWLIKSGSSSSNMVLTDQALSVIAKNINLTGLVTFSSFSQDAKDKIEEAKKAGVEAQNSLNNLLIGGENLINGTNQSEIVLGTYPSTGCSEGKTYKTNTLLLDEEYILSFDAKSTVNNDSIRCFLYNPSTITSVETSTGFKGVGIDGVADLIITNQWKRYWIKYKHKPNDDTIAKTVIVGRRCSGNGTGTVSVRAVKLEKGNKDSDWCPSREDIHNSINSLGNDLQNQIDGKIETFSQATDPSSAWTTSALKTQHTGDLWYNTSVKETKRWSGSAWVTLEDSVASNAQSLAQQKRRIFTTTPTTPYEIGDLWVGGPSGDIQKCKTSLASGAFNSAHWEKASKYTDDTKANQTATNLANLCHANNQTMIDGSKIYTGTVNTVQLAANAVTAEKITTANISGIGGWINLSNGTFDYGSGKLKWDASTLTIGGATGFHVTNGAIYRGNAAVGAAGAGNIYLGENGFSLGDKLVFDNTGKLVIKGKAIIDEGTIGGWRIISTRIDNNAGAMDKPNYFGIVNEPGKPLIVSSDASGAITFRLDIGGKLTARNVDISGVITATSGKIANWEIASNGISRPYSTTTTDYLFSLYSSPTAGTSSAIAIRQKPLGTNEWDNQFVVRYDGKLTAKNADIKGVIDATSIIANKSYGIYYNDALKNITCIQAKNVDSQPSGWRGDIYMGMLDAKGLDDSTSYIKFRAITGGGVMELNTGQGVIIKGGLMSASIDQHGFNTDKILEGGIELSSKYAAKTHYHTSLKTSDVTRPYVGTSADGLNIRSYLDGSIVSGKINLGSGSSLWTRVYAVNATISTSDVNEKCNIKNLDERYEKLFMNLRPVSYRWKNFEESDAHDRTHTGLIAQEVESSALKCGLNAQEFAAICIDELENPTADGRTKRYGLAYGEMHGLEIYMIQKLYKKLEQLETEISLCKKS